MPTLSWLGKDAVVDHHRHLPIRDLREDPDLAIPGPLLHTLIEGDNLEALAALVPEYRARVRCIYIDPPYNTGNETWVYNDAVNSPATRSWLGRVVGREDLDRHDKWLCFMYPRLALLRELLAADGCLFISIDDTELAALQFLLDELFGSENRLATFTWVRKKKGSHLDRHLRRMTEFVVAMAKDASSLPPLFGEAAYAEKWQPLVKRTNRTQTLVIPAGAAETTLAAGMHPAGVRGSGGTALRYHEDLVVADGRIAGAVTITGNFVWTQPKLDAELALGTRIAVSRAFGLNVRRWDQAQKTKRPSTLLSALIGVGTNEDASQEVMEILGSERGVAFAFPKPVSLVECLLRTVCRDDPTALVLDAFAGSGTTGHAVMQLNAADGGTRRAILMQLGEDQGGGPNIARTITRERLLRAATGYAVRGVAVPGLDQGWRYCRLGNPVGRLELGD